MSLFVSERKSAAAAVFNLKVHLPGGVLGGTLSVAPQMFGSVEPATGLIVMSAGIWASGACGSSVKFARRPTNG